MKRITIKSFFEDVKNTGSIPVSRSKMIENSADAPLPESYPVNILADTIHPKNFSLKIKKCEVKDSFISLELTFADESKAFYFRCGQLLGIKYLMGDTVHFASLPVMSLSGERVLKIAFLRDTDKDLFLYFSENTPDEINCVSFEGNATFSGIRDKKKAVILTDDMGLASGASLCGGITGDYGDSETVLFCECNNQEFSDFISSETGIVVQKYSSENTFEEYSGATLFLIGRKSFCDSKAFLKEKAFYNVRVCPFDTVKEYDSEKCYNVKVIYRGGTSEISCREGERLSNALLRTGVPIDVRCSDGECGFCRLRLISGEVRSILTTWDRRTAADVQYGYIHPCSVTPMGDITVEL